MKLILFWILLNLPFALAFDPDYANGITPRYLVYLQSYYLPCTGVLVHPLWVITAASCNLPSLHVILGVTNPSNLTEQNVQVVGYEKMIHHPHFSITSIENNLMLIKLNRYVEFNDYIRPAGLPNGLVPEDTACMVSTWAYNLCDAYKDPNSLQNVNISVISKTRCRDGYKTHNIKQSMLCLGILPGRRQPCKEVAAAPAVCNGKLQGILTFADGCVLRADVGIYTKIFSYMSWIENTIQNN